MSFLQVILSGMLCIFATLAYAQEDIGGRLIADKPTLEKWKSEDGQELYELRTTGNAIFFERIAPPQDRMYGEFFRGTLNKEGERYWGTASAVVLQIVQGRATHTCTIQMSVTLSSVTPGRIEGNARPERIDPDCTPNNFSTTMTAPAFAWIPAAEGAVPLPQIQRRIEASRQYQRRMEASALEYQRESQYRQAELEKRQRPNQRLRGCEAALRQQQIFCSAHYPYTYPARPYFPPWGPCGEAQNAVRASCY